MFHVAKQRIGEAAEQVEFVGAEIAEAVKDGAQFAQNLDDVSLASQGKLHSKMRFHTEKLAELDRAMAVLQMRASIYRSRVYELQHYCNLIMDQRERENAAD